jgi:hypothetical protein
VISERIHPHILFLLQDYSLYPNKYSSQELGKRWSTIHAPKNAQLLDLNDLETGQEDPYKSPSSYDGYAP